MSAPSAPEAVQEVRGGANKWNAADGADRPSRDVLLMSDGNFWRTETYQRSRIETSSCEFDLTGVPQLLEVAEARIKEVEARLELSAAEALKMAVEAQEQGARVKEARRHLGDRDRVSKVLASFREGKILKLERSQKVHAAKVQRTRVKVFEVTNSGRVLDICRAHLNAVKALCVAETWTVAKLAAVRLASTQTDLMSTLTGSVCESQTEHQALAQHLVALGTEMVRLADTGRLPPLDCPHVSGSEPESLSVTEYLTESARALLSVQMV
jgi:hypothetical protein